MTENDFSIVEIFPGFTSGHKCGYCKSSSSSISDGMWAYELTVEHYQNLIDRGWRRSGHYCYKPIMTQTCCPMYTIKCTVKDFRLSKSQKKILKKFNQFLVSGDVKKTKFRNGEMDHVIDNQEAVVAKKSKLNSKEKVIEKIECEGVSYVKGDQQTKVIEDNVEKLNVSKTIRSITSTTDDTLVHTEVNEKKSRKAKFLRIKRKREKLRRKGLTEDEIAAVMTSKKKIPVVKTLEEYLTLPNTDNLTNKLQIKLVRSTPKSDEFETTFDQSFELFKLYEGHVHHCGQDKLTQKRFTKFLIDSPLKIKLVKFGDVDFTDSFQDSHLLFSKYQQAVHKEAEDETNTSVFTSFLIDTPLEAQGSKFGSYHQQYWLNDKLIGVGVIDILPKCVSSVYFYYDPEYSYLSLGTYGALREVEFTRKLMRDDARLENYYMGYYIHTCPKMRYKSKLSPSYLLCPEVYTWHNVNDCLKKLDINKYSRFNEDDGAVDGDGQTQLSHIMVLFNRKAMKFTSYASHKVCTEEEKETLLLFSKLIGKTCLKNFLIYRPS